ncbi:HD family phosphohydrolase [Pseudobacteroides cellulosolvens]|uniref:7TM receptor with intracellular metal dependent phosphohydrolase n=1 Tax=Pseudobacteroides cellulosolvens ATCC 35603 = DSM 2933 TaxID=398512 RepID=A0A0L6JK60_9FIRM|nr:HDIG domain-containing metalloprotein [Pseudobacteroides cellulosolvens]KNY25742.1 7TM receptor with intracellular metal dependent phosphohydrolase [Pseudobacteroides cellulosolvens ATCC 35603 = DSM 2933]
MIKEKELHTHGLLKIFLKSKTVHRYLIAIFTIILFFIVVVDGASPKKYSLSVGEISSYDIISPGNIVDEVNTTKNRKEAEAAIASVMIKDVKASAEALKKWVDFVLAVEKSRKNSRESIKDIEAFETDGSVIEDSIKEILQKEALNLDTKLKELDISLTNDLLLYVVSENSCKDKELDNFKDIVEGHIDEIISKSVSKEKLSLEISKIEASINSSNMPQELKFVASSIIKSIIKPNWIIDEVATSKLKKEAYDDIKNIVTIEKGARILAIGEKVTEDKLKILEDLNLLRTKSRFDFAFVGGILVLVIFLAFFLILYMRHFNRKSLYSRRDIAIICIVISIVILIARGLYEISPTYSPMTIPVCVAAMLISILLDLKLAIVINLVLTIAVAIIVKGDISFIYMSTISGTFAAYFVSNSTQRSRLSLAGVVIGAVNVIIMLCFGLIYKQDWNNIIKNSLIVFMNGLGSMVLTIGIAPFLESIFNIVTPLKLIELANPNHPLIKRLLLEAPGTYHHSLMVGNLAEVATEAIGGNPILARVGAYFHDVGKLKRPHFFTENQMGENPHDKITANLSTLIITSHISDGIELADKYKLPNIIKDIIRQHHGETLVAYFYHKAKTVEKAEDVKTENFRYQGPKPKTKESAVVLLADSVEAAVRSMTDKTEGKIEGFVRKIIKDKLDDGQLDQCNLTLKDLDTIAVAFMKVLSGFFHAREKYPEIKPVNNKITM